MSESFDPYRVWLSIPSGSRPPTHYQLLGISPDEQDATVINAAVMRQSAYVRNFQIGKYAEEAARILSEIQAAKACLLDPVKRTKYDAELNARQSAAVHQPSREAAATAPLVPYLDIDLLAAVEAQPPLHSTTGAYRRSKPMLLRNVKGPRRPRVAWLAATGVTVGVLTAIAAFALWPRRDERRLSAAIDDPVGAASTAEVNVKPSAADAGPKEAVEPPPPSTISPFSADEARKQPPVAAAPTSQQDRWQAFDLGGNTVIDDFVRITHGRLSTRASYGGPIEISVVARTDKDNIRIRAFEGAECVIWNWEVNPSELRVHRADSSPATAAVTPLAINTWYRLRWCITANEMDAYVDDNAVFHESGGPYIGEASPVWAETVDGSVVDIKSFEVTPLPATPPTPPAVGVDFPGEVNGMKGGAQLAVAPGFDIAKSWRLSLEFWTPKFPGDLWVERQYVFFWGDDRMDHDAIDLRFRGSQLMVQVDNDMAGVSGPVLLTRLSPVHLSRWVAVQFQYDAPANVCSLFLDGKRVARESSSIVPTIDRPMPVYLCHAHGTAPFWGRVRNVRLENVEQ